MFSIELEIHLLTIMYMSFHVLTFSTHLIKLYSSFHSDGVARAVLRACDLSWDDGSQQGPLRSQHHTTALIHDSQRGFPNAFLPSTPLR